MLRKISPEQSIAIAVAGVGTVVALLLYFELDHQVLELLQWLEHQGFAALVWFVLIMVLLVLLLVPGFLFTTGAGFVFGVTHGAVAVVLGTTIGATLAFLISRHFFSEGTRRYILSNRWLGLVNRGLGERGFRIVLLTRLVPFFPGKLSNYLFGLSQVSLRDFIAASAIGFIPFSLHNVYLGSLAADIATLGSRNIERTPLEWSLYGAGFVMCVVFVLYVNRLASQMLARELREQSVEKPHDTAGASES